MAEAIIRSHYPGISVYSAGVQPAKNVSSRAIAVLQEKNYSTELLYAKDVSRLMNHSFDLVLTVCDNAKQRCPHFPGALKQMHVPFDDPYNAQGSEDEIMNVYRRVRDEIVNWIIHQLALIQRD